MRSLVAWLLGVDPQTFGPDAELSLRLNQAPEGWLVFLLALGVIVFTVWVYRRDGRDSASLPMRVFLGVLRALLIAMALLVLTEPVLLATRTETKPSTVLVLLDDSFSMKLGFPYAEDELRARVRAALGPKFQLDYATEDGKVERVPVDKLELHHYGQISRMQVACQALRKGTAPFLEELRKQHEVRLFTYSQGLRTTDSAGRPLTLEADKDPEPAGPETRIGDALRQALREARGLPLAGVVLLGDGRQNAGEDAVQVATSQYRLQRVPLFTAGVGDPGEPKDIELSIDGQDEILPNDPAEVTAGVRQKGYDSLGTLKVEMRDGEKTIAAEEIKLGKSGEKTYAALKFRMDKPGKYSFTVSVPRQDGELREENNRCTYTFKVVDKKVKVLFVEGQDWPRWEYRYLKNALIRDHTTEADVLLATTDGAWLWEGSPGKQALDSFPKNRKEIGEFEVVIFGDISPTIFTKEELKLVREFVRDGGGFIMIAGERFMPSEYLAGELTELLPVVPQGTAPQAPAEGFQEFFPLELTAEGRKMTWTHLDPDDHANREIWENLPKQPWYYPVKRIKEFAAPVAVHPFVKDDQGQKMSLIATMPYGAGRVMFIGVDQLWRWRLGVGDRYHYRFYNQAIRYLSTTKRGGQKRFMLGADKSSYAIGDRVTLTALIKDDKFNPLNAESVNAYVKSPKGDTQAVELHRLRDREGTYEGHLFPSERGDYAFWLKDEQQPDVRQSEFMLKVDVPQLELENPRMDEELLRALAAAGGEGGKYVPIDKLNEIPPLITPRVEKVPREVPVNLWDNWSVLLLFALLITLEWVLRKRVRMV